MAESHRRFSIGYALAPKKQQTFIRSSLLSLASDRGMDLLAVDPSLPISDQGPFDCIIHKIYGEEWKTQILRFTSQNPEIPVVDAPYAIDRLRNRVSMLQIASGLEIPQTTGTTLGIPNQVVIYNSDALSGSADIKSLRFPVISKPLMADGSASSHKMALVFKSFGLVNLKPPFVLQEFVNHGGVVFKVYVVGDYVKCVKRRSLPDISKETMECSEGSMSFSQVSNMAARGRAEGEPEEAEMPPEGFVTDVARAMGKAMGLHFFNFDMIRDVANRSRYLMIDINYFPGFEKLPSYETIVTDFLWNVVHKKDEYGFGSAIRDDNQEKKAF